MPYHNVIALMFILILVFLLLKSPTNTAQVISALGSNVTSLTSTLQGNNSGNMTSTVSPTG